MQFSFLKEDWNSELAPYRDLTGWIVGLVVLNGPGLFWLYIVIDALQKAPSSAYWFGQTPTGEMSVFAEYSGAIGLFVIWTGLVLALFAQPLGKTVSEIRAE